MTLHRTLLGALLLVGTPALVRAQVAPTTAPDTGRGQGVPWLLSYFPYLSGGLGNGPVFTARARYFQPSPWDDRLTYRADFVAEGGVGLHGSRMIRLATRAPLLAKDWRAAGELGARRNTRANFYGLGNGTEDQPTAIDADPFAYEVQHTSYRARAEVSRRLSGPLWLAAGAGVSHDRFYSLSPQSAFGLAYGDASTDTDLRGKVELVLDTRDTEWDPTRGILAEAGVERGSGGEGYTRLFGMVRGYASPRPGTVLAARFGASDLHGTPPLSARLAIPTWEDPIRVYGGGHTNRGLDGNRFAGTGVLMGSGEIRQYLKSFKQAVDVALVGFVDAGRVFEGERLRLTTDHLKVSAGAGLAVRILRANMIIANVADGPEGANVSFSAGWAF